MVVAVRSINELRVFVKIINTVWIGRGAGMIECSSSGTVPIGGGRTGIEIDDRISNAATFNINATTAAVGRVFGHRAIEQGSATQINASAKTRNHSIPTAVRTVA